MQAERTAIDGTHLQAVLYSGKHGTFVKCNSYVAVALNMKPAIFPDSAPVTWEGSKTEKQAQCRARGVGIFENIIFN